MENRIRKTGFRISPTLVLVILVGGIMAGSLIYSRWQEANPPSQSNNLETPADPVASAFEQDLHPQILAVSRLVNTLVRLAEVNGYPISKKQVEIALPHLKSMTSLEKLEDTKCQEIFTHIARTLTMEQQGAMPNGRPGRHDYPQQPFNAENPYLDGPNHERLKELIKAVEKWKPKEESPDAT